MTQPDRGQLAAGGRSVAGGLVRFVGHHEPSAAKCFPFSSDFGSRSGRLGRRGYRLALVFRA